MTRTIVGDLNKVAKILLKLLLFHGHIYVFELLIQNPKQITLRHLIVVLQFGVLSCLFVDR